MSFRYNEIKKQLKDNYQLIVVDAITGEDKLVQYYDDQIIDENGKWWLWNEYFKNNAPKKIIL